MKRMMVLASAMGALALAGCGGKGLGMGRADMAPADVEIVGVSEGVQAFLDTISGKEVAHIMSHYSAEYLNDGWTVKDEAANWSAIFAKADHHIRFADLTLRNCYFDARGGAVAQGLARYIESVDGSMTEGWVAIKLFLAKDKAGDWQVYGNQLAKVSFSNVRSWRQILGDNSKASSQTTN